MIFIFLCCYRCLWAQDNSLEDLERIVVTKSKIHLYKTYDLDQDDLKDLPFNSPLETLTLTELDLQARAAKGAIQDDFSLRGSTFQGVLVLFNGQRINDPQTGHHNSDIPLTRADIKRIEITPGVSSAVFGPDAIGGALNFILKKPEENKLLLEFSGGQHTSHSSLFSITRRIDQAGIRVSVENNQSDGYREDTDFKKFNATADSTIGIPLGEIRASYGYQEKEFGAPDFYTPGSNYLSQEWTKTHLLNAGANIIKEGLLIRPNFLWRRHFDKFLLDKTLIRSSYLNHHRTDMLTPNIYLQKELVPLGRVGFGLEYGQELINSTNLGKHGRAHTSVYLDQSKDLMQGFSFGLAARSDDFEGFDRKFSGSGSLRYSFLTASSLTLGLSRSIRVPSFTELYYSDPTTEGNPDLSAEKSVNYQLEYNYAGEDFSFSLAAFLRDEDEFIDWVKRAPSQSKWVAENIGEAYVSGFENNLSLKINQYLELKANYTYTDKNIREKQYLYKYGPNYARHLLNNLLEFNLPFGRQVVSYSYKKKDGRGGWSLLNLSLSYGLLKHSRIFFKATNILDKRYEEILGVPQPGRWLEGGLSFEW